MELRQIWRKYRLSNHYQYLHPSRRSEDFWVFQDGITDLLRVFLRKLLHFIFWRKKWIWSKDCQRAFKQDLISAPVLISPDFNDAFKVQTDTSECGLGAVLTRTSGGICILAFKGAESILYIRKRVSSSGMGCRKVATLPGGQTFWGGQTAGMLQSIPVVEPGYMMGIKQQFQTTWVFFSRCGLFLKMGGVVCAKSHKRSYHWPNTYWRNLHSMVNTHLPFVRP